jgi:hypothetical protein
MTAQFTNASEVGTDVRLNGEQQDRKNEKKVRSIFIFLFLSKILGFNCVENSYCDHPSHGASPLGG